MGLLAVLFGVVLALGLSVAQPPEITGESLTAKSLEVAGVTRGGQGVFSAQAGPAIDVSPKSINYGQVPVGQTKAAVLTIKNTGTVPLLVTVGLQLGQHFDFCGLIPTGFTLLPGQSATIRVCFSPKALGLHTDQVIVRAVVPGREQVIEVKVPVQGEGIRAGTKIPGAKFEDLNGNGRWEFTDTNGNGRWDPGEPGEPGIAGWRITLLGPEAQTTTTGADGRFEFVVRTAGTYTLSEEIREGWRPTTPTRVVVTLRLIPGETIAEILFGNQRVAAPGLQVELTIDRGCGATYRIGDPIVISFRASQDAVVTLKVRMPDGSERMLLVNQLVRGGVTNTLPGTVGEPPGSRLLILDAVAGEQRSRVECAFTAVRGEVPAFKAQITTDRGCLEKGQNPVYFVDDSILIQFRIDGVAQALATIEDILPNGLVRVIFRQVVPGNQTLRLTGKIEPPVGRETLRLTAQAGELIARDECSFIVSARITPPSLDLLLIFNLEAAPLLLVTDKGTSVQSDLSGQILVGVRGSLTQVEAMMLYGESVLTARGETGPVTLMLGQSRGGTAHFEASGTLILNVGFEGLLTYPLLDQLLGVREFEDYTESLTETVSGRLSYSGRFNPESLRLEGLTNLEFSLVQPLLGAIPHGLIAGFFLPISFEPLLMFNTNIWEICVEFVFGDKKEDKDAWQAEDLEKMLDEAKEIWQQCNIRVRMKSKLRSKEQCIKVVLKKELKEGGGGICKGKGQGKNSSVLIGRNVVADCSKKKVDTTYGKVLAHELGHSLDLPQKSKSGGLMDDCAPSDKIDEKDCETARKKATKINTPEGIAEGLNSGRVPRVPAVPGGYKVKEKTFVFTNNTGKDADDLHIEFQGVTQVWVESQKRSQKRDDKDDQRGFKDIAGDSTTSIDLSRGEVKNGEQLEVTFSAVVAGEDWPKKGIKSCFWTKEGKNIGACKIEEK